MGKILSVRQRPLTNCIIKFVFILLLVFIIHYIIVYKKSFLNCYLCKMDTIGSSTVGFLQAPATTRSIERLVKYLN